MLDSETAISSGPAAPLHPAQRRYLAEDLVRLRRSDDTRRYVGPQRAGKIDPNPHQVEAVIFALARYREGGCILADEVGLGKTIEAGLVIAQLRAEGASRILLIAPKPLLGQWRQELLTLFDIGAREGEAREGGFDGPGVFLVGREAAGSERGRDALLHSGPFDLCVIDEAHEVFAGIYKRFDKYGEENPDSLEARTAARVRDVLVSGRTPVLLLTATPIQNSLSELWGLVTYVDPEGTLLGDLPTFREVFCGEDDRQLLTGQEEELRARLRRIVQRTLRRQAQEFLDKPFVARHARKFDYEMSPRERALYDDVTRYLLEPDIVAFQGKHRHLLLTGFHRRMASSTRALAGSLRRVADRLERMLAKGSSAQDDASDARVLLSDLEEDVLEGAVEATGTPPESPVTHDPEHVRAELARVRSFVERANGLSDEDSKFRALLRALSFVSERVRQGQGSGKLVVFTESVETQDYLRDRLVESKLVTDQEITLFRGTNESPRAVEALGRWRTETPQDEGAKPSASMAVRLALVHEFRTRSRVLISTEAGAKGLNLQFCETVVNYDLPWNPQRIEQRIGRCHRYGQRHEVTVINFLAKDNEAEQLTFEILSQKLDLFGVVLGASDEVLHRPDEHASEPLAGVLGADVETALRRIWDHSRTIEEVNEELRALRDRVDEQRRRFVETRARTASVIEETFDEAVQKVFRLRKYELPGALAELDRDLFHVVVGYLTAQGYSFDQSTIDGGLLLHVAPSERLPGPLRSGLSAAVGSVPNHTSLHLGHPLVLAAVDEARSSGSGPFRVEIRLPTGAPPELRKRSGQLGRLRLVKIRYEGFEPVERLIPVAVAGNDMERLPLNEADALLRAELRDETTAPTVSIPTEVLDDAGDEVLFELQGEVDGAEQRRFEAAIQQAERFVQDRVLVLRRRRAELASRLESAEARRDSAVGADRRTELEGQVKALGGEIDRLDERIAELERREDETFKRYREKAHARRYAEPLVERLFEMEFVIR